VEGSTIPPGTRKSLFADATLNMEAWDIGYDFAIVAAGPSVNATLVVGREPSIMPGYWYSDGGQGRNGVSSNKVCRQIQSCVTRIKFLEETELSRDKLQISISCSQLDCESGVLACPFTLTID
jgi:hypothetical protein